ncbi:MAG: SIS domain-containing protein [Proteobacteria bacterium]|nr:SIS domain-containing protein [Pseudomonadota bacterium]MBS0573852.1 SIS domain-containing protein [Pseudomonadota bacterium]
MMERSAPSQMAAEIGEIPHAVERLLSGGDTIRAAARAAAALDPRVIATVARGSSDHAATYLKYAAELTLGLPVASIGPSVASIYGARLKLDRAVAISVSQSGQSPDIVEMARSARAGGALTIAVTNNAGSPLAQASERTIDIAAGPELSVAATKTYVTSVVALLGLVAEWTGDAGLAAAIHALPGRLAAAAALDWPEVRQALQGAPSVFTLGRGPAYAVACEAALKFKEISQLHAESYSSAEVLHGPVSIVGEGFPVLAFAARDAAEGAVTDIADQIAAKGARVFVTSDRAAAASRLPFVATGHPLTDPLALIVSFYAMVERFAREAGIDPDKPRHLRKVTETR